MNALIEYVLRGERFPEPARLFTLISWRGAASQICSRVQKQTRGGVAYQICCPAQTHTHTHEGEHRSTHTHIYTHTHTQSWFSQVCLVRK